MDSSAADPRGTRPGGPGWDAEEADSAQLTRFRQFLADEAVSAGGLGPHELDRLDDRHIHDSLGFSVAWHGEPAPQALLDVGTGVGLPGVPLAILWPHCRVGLLERSGRRARLLRRLVRILGLTNAIVLETDIDHVEGAAWEGAGIVMRAVFPPRSAVERLEHLDWERLVVASGDHDTATWGERVPFRVFARVGWVRTMRRA